MKRNGSLRRRCPCCNKSRKFREPDGNNGGEYHPRRPPWIFTPFGLSCGFCYIKHGCKISLFPRETLRQRVLEAATKDGLQIYRR
jgi:hypothetical protein